VLELFAPNLYVSSIYEIDLPALKKAGVTTIITDLDNTLVESDSIEATPKLIKWLDDLQEMGFKVMIVLQFLIFIRPKNRLKIPSLRR